MHYRILATTTLIILAMMSTARAADSKDLLENALGTDIDITAGSSWDISDGVLIPAAGEAMTFAYTRKTYSNFDLTLEFYPVGQANSGVFVRCADPESISPQVCYEFNIWDAHANAAFKTGAIVLVSPPSTSVETEDRWNTMRIRVDGTHLQVWVNDMLTNDIMNNKYRSGHIAFQYGGNNSMVRFRNIRIQELP